MKIILKSEYVKLVEQALNSNIVIGDEMEQKKVGQWESEAFISNEMALEVADELNLHLKSEPFNMTIGEDYTLSLEFTKY